MEEALDTAREADMLADDGGFFEALTDSPSLGSSSSEISGIAFCFPKLFADRRGGTTVSSFFDQV